jgi:hypothetical protein
MNPKKSRVDVKFILDAVEKYAQRTPDEIKEDFKSDPLHSIAFIDHPDGRSLTIGREAHGRLIDLSKQFLADDPVKKGATDLNKLIPLVGTELIRSFVVERRKVVIDNIVAALLEAHNLLAVDHEAITHYIPCAAMFSWGSKAFKIGPVEFVPQELFFEAIGDDLNQYPDLAATRGEELLAAWRGKDRSGLKSADEFRCDGEKSVEAVNNYYREYPWVTVVSVSPCSERVSRDRAVFAVRGAVNIIKLLLGASASDRMRVAEDSADPLRFHRLFRLSNGELNISSHWRLNGNPAQGNWDDFLESDVEPYLLALNRVLEIVTVSPEPPYLCAKFFRALSWFGDAVSEPSPGPRIVKYVSAIESIVGTGKKDIESGDSKVTSMVLTRAGHLYAKAMSIEFKEAEKQLGKIYGWRSGLVHGSLSYFDESLPRNAADTAEVARMILLMGLNLFDCMGLDNSVVSDESLKDAFIAVTKPTRDHERPPELR